MEPRGRERQNRQVEWSFGKSDIEGKVAMGSSELAWEVNKFQMGGST